MTFTEDHRLTIEPTSDVDEDRADPDQNPEVAEAARPGCVFTAALRHRVERGDAIAVPAPPHIATLESDACHHFWVEWAERVRAAVGSQRGR